ncbi:MAG: CoA-binding protein [Acidimicrobiaceae bacterium]|nr:CoA-binding protein [Acidimicrobiaceae bacterium]
MLERDEAGLLASHYLSRIIRPRSIAVVGASDDPTRIGGRPIAATIEMGFEGEIYPINPKYKEIFQMKTYASLGDLPMPPDLVVVSVGAKMVESVVREAAEAGAGSLVVFSSGYAELDQVGADAQERLSQLCEEVGIPLLGPNCLGVINTSIGSAATFTATLESGTLKTGSVGFACQSGAFGSYFLAQARRRGLGVHTWIATGNEAVVTIADCISYLADDPEISVIAGYIEGVRNGRALMVALERAQRAGKPVVLLKAGRSEAGGRAALSHTGAMVGDDRVFDAVFDRYGVSRAADLEDLIEIAEAASFDCYPKSLRSALLTVSGGVGIMMADQAIESGIELPAVPEDLKERLRSLVPFAGLENPIDFTGQFLNDANIAGAFLEELCTASLVDSVVVFLGHTSLAESLAAPAIRRIVEVRKRFGVPIFFSGLTTDILLDELREAGIPVIENPVRAVRLVAAMHRLGTAKASEDDREVPAPLDLAGLQLDWDGGILPEWESLQLLRRLGAEPVRTIAASNPDGAVAAAGELGYPVVIKSDCPSLMHKSEAGAVVLGVGSSGAVRDAFERVTVAAATATGGSHVRGVLVQEMVPPQLEFIVGAKRDPEFGAVVVVGTGGVLAEVIGDSVVALAGGLTRRDAIELISRTRAGSSIISGRFRSATAADSLADAILAVAKLISQVDDVSEVDVNPVAISRGGRAVALDALVILRS